MNNYAVKAEVPEEVSNNLGGYTEILRKLLFYRGIKNVKDAEDFFNPSFDKNYDPFLLKDMDIAVERVFEAIEKKQKIVIYSSPSRR